jgi:hypothetical protein
VAARDLRVDLRVRIGQREHDGPGCHPGHVLLAEQAGRADPDEHVRVVQDLSQLAIRRSGLGVLGQPSLLALDVLPAWVQDAMTVEHGDLAGAGSPNPAATALMHRIISGTSRTSRHSGQASMPANRLYSAALPSSTGSAARGPISPRPSTADPSLTTATELPRTVSR